MARTSCWQTSNYTRIYNDKRLLLKPFGYKVITVYVTHGYCFQTWEDSWGHPDTSKHTCNCSCITAIARKALHQSKQIWGSVCYNIEHWLQAFSISFYLCLFQIFKSCAVHMTRNVQTSLCRAFHRTHWGSFFLLWDKTETKIKCKTHSIDKEETSIMTLKSFSYKVISKYWHVNQRVR